MVKNGDDDDVAEAVLLRPPFPLGPRSAGRRLPVAGGNLGEYLIYSLAERKSLREGSRPDRYLSRFLLRVRKSHYADNGTSFIHTYRWKKSHEKCVYDCGAILNKSKDDVEKITFEVHLYTYVCVWSHGKGALLSAN